MSSIEERLVRDIAAITGGVVVTESDLRSAREAVEDRLHDQQQRGRRRTLAAVAAAAVVLPIAGVVAFQTLGGDEAAPPATPAPVRPDVDDAPLSGRAPTPQLLHGLWRLDNGTAHYRFLPDGTVAMDETGQVVHDPAFTGTYRIEDGEISVDVITAPEGCAGGTHTLRASLPERGILRFVSSDWDANACLTPVGEGRLEQLLPSALYDDFVWDRNSDARPVTGSTSLQGLWVALAAREYAVELSPAGSFVVLDRSADVVDDGEWSLRGSRLTLTSSGTSATCSRGDRLVWSGLEQVDPGTPHIRGTLVENTCGAEWATVPGWFLIPHQGSRPTGP